MPLASSRPLPPVSRRREEIAVLGIFAPSSNKQPATHRDRSQDWGSAVNRSPGFLLPRLYGQSRMCHVVVNYILPQVGRSGNLF